MREYRIRKQRNQKRKIGYLIFLILFSVLFMLLVLWGGKAILKVHAVEQSSSRYKYYTEVYVRQDDTLWDIAQEYMTEEYDSVEEYIEEVREINSIYFSDIYYGQILMVPYYSDEWKL